MDTCTIEADVEASELSELVGRPIDIRIPGSLSPIRYGVVAKAVRDGDSIQCTMRDGKTLRIEVGRN